MGTKNEPRLTIQSLKVLDAFLQSRGYRAAGAELMKSTKLASGTIYPILFRFEEAGLLRGEWEDGDAKDLGRPRRRFYVLTGAGQTVARNALNQFASSTVIPQALRNFGVFST